MAEMDDQELFSSAIADAPIEVADTPADAPTTEAPQQDGPSRDEHGRFVSPRSEQAPEPVPQAGRQPEPGEAFIPPGRLREEREERERLQKRYDQDRANWQRQFELMQQQAQPKPEPAPVPDMFENPGGFVGQYVDPIKSEVQQMREFYSRRDAERDHGADKVRAAYDWIASGIAQRDPDVVMAYNRAMQSPHPFDVLVAAHQQRTVYQTIGNDPNAWFEKELERRMSGDPQFAAKFQQARQASSAQPQGGITKLPPSLRSVPSARGAVDDDTDMSDAALFRYATR